MQEINIWDLSLSLSCVCLQSERDHWRLKPSLHSIHFILSFYSRFYFILIIPLASLVQTSPSLKKITGLIRDQQRLLRLLHIPLSLCIHYYSETIAWNRDEKETRTLRLVV